jgi:integrase
MFVKRAKPGMHCDGGGLYLQVTPTTDGRGFNRSWIFRYRAGNRQRDMGIGSVHDRGLAEARMVARKLRQDRLEGIDPIETRKQRKADEVTAAVRSVTFWQCCEQYLAAHKASWTNAKHAAQWRSSLEAYAKPAIGSLPAAMVDTAAVMRCVEPIWATKTETAGRVRSRIEAVLGWATTKGYRQGDNPARWSKHLENLLPGRTAVAPQVNFESLPFAELPTFMAKLREHQGVIARALEFTILTATRTGEAIGATWDEISLADRTWTIPKARMKTKKTMKRDHAIPLSDRAIAILQEMATVRESDAIFPGSTHKFIGPSGLLQFLQGARGMQRTDVTVHGFRATFRTWAGDRTGFPREMIESALAHMIGSAVEESYNRGSMLQKRKALMTAWSDYCGGRPGADVVHLVA